MNITPYLGTIVTVIIAVGGVYTAIASRLTRLETLIETLAKTVEKHNNVEEHTTRLARIAVSLAIDGEPIASSRAIVTPAEAEQYFNVTSTAIITVPKRCCYTVAVENVNAGVGGEIADEQTISVADGNLTVTRIA